MAQKNVKNGMWEICISFIKLINGYKFLSYPLFIVFLNEKKNINLFTPRNKQIFVFTAILNITRNKKN